MDFRQNHFQENSTAEKRRRFLESFYEEFENEETIEIKTSNGDSFKSHGNEILQKTNGFQGWDCEAGINNLTIWNDGTIHRCEADIETEASEIFTEDFSFSCLEKEDLPSK